MLKEYHFIGCCMLTVMALWRRTTFGNTSTMRCRRLPKTRFRSIAFASLFALLAALAKACPFCSALSNTLTENLAESEVAGLAICVAPAILTDTDALPIHRFRILQVIKGDRKLVGRTFEVVSFKPFERQEVSFLVGVGEGNQIDWAPSAPVSNLAQEYLRSLVSVPADGPERLEFFLSSLDSPDRMVADDAYNEFARASLKDLIALKPKLDRERIIDRINDAGTSRDYRRLYWTLLGICGQSSDVKIVEEAIRKRSVSDHNSLGMDAAFSCYLSLGGEAALQQIEKNYFANPAADYVDCYAAILAIRVQSEEIKQFPSERLKVAFRIVLERGELADLVIPDLARWEDWSIVDRVEELFKQTEQATQYVKLPIINYLRVCPTPEAVLALERCARLDPSAVRRAETMFPLVKRKATEEVREEAEDKK